MYQVIENLVTIIMPCYNSENYIEDTIKSVLAQKYKEWELIIVDDFSTDNSVKIIENLINNDKRIKLIKSKNNRGAGHSRNKAIKIAEGEYYAFLDSDDLWYPNKLDNQITFMKNNKIAFSYTGYNFISESGEFKNHFLQAKNKIKYSDLLKTNHIGCLTVIYNA